jgi:hypothetical protein
MEFNKFNNMKSQLEEIDEKKISFQEVRIKRAKVTYMNNLLNYIPREQGETDDDRKKKIKKIISTIKKTLGQNVLIKEKLEYEVEDTYGVACLNIKERLQETLIKLLNLSVKDFDKDYSEIENQ